MIIGTGIPAGMALAHEDELHADPALKPVSRQELRQRNAEPVPAGYCLVWLPGLANAENVNPPG